MLEQRVGRLQEAMRAKRLDALLVTDLANVFYLTGFTGSTAAVIVDKQGSHILVDPRYTVQATAECKTSRVVEYAGKSTIAAAAELASELRPGRLGYEADDLSVSLFRAMRSGLGDGISLRATQGMVEELRRIKDQAEIDLIRDAAKIADDTFSAITRELAIGMSEKDVALLIDSTMRKLGADKDAFETIAAFGSNAACPHWSPTDAVLASGGMLKMDFGARYRMYNSDITRTVCIGKPDERLHEVYNVVLEAQLKAIDAIGPGTAGKDVDAVARDYITSKGYGENFGHGLGHGLGILVHDGPALSRTSPVVLQPGMVVTVEPGVYIEGWGGVRIEDDVLVTSTGAQIITKSTKDLLEL